ncbi:MAG: antibiotic ABC transporter ATP-binding protein [Flavobacteriales bacterium]|nr:antibiotic ABC transporter ATP-binding protein [Flavobacteriales bacterium]
MKTIDLKLLYRLLKFVRPYKNIFIITILTSIFFGVLSALRPILIQFAFDNYISNNDSLGLLIIMSILLFLLFIEAFLQYIFIYKSNFLSQKIIQNLRVHLFTKILSFRISYFDQNSTGKLITRVISDMESIASIFSQGLLVVFGDVFKMILVILCMFIVSWELALISLFFLPLLIFLTFKFQSFMHSAFQDIRKYVAKLNIFLFEHIVGMSVVQLFSKEEEEFSKFKELNSRHRDAHIKTVLYFSIFLPIVDVFSAIVMGLVVWYGSLSIVYDNNLSVGQIIAFILFINMLFRPLRAIADRFNVLQMGLVASSRVFSLIDQSKEEEKNELIEYKFEKLEGSISFKDVSFFYRKNEPVLTKISFDIPLNSTVAIIGPTGSGKTTILNLLMKWYKIQSGSISINNLDLNQIPTSVLRKNLGVVLQDSFFLADTLMNNIKFFNNISDETVYEAVHDIGIEDFINKFPEKYDYQIGERGAGLSEGEKQLVSFLRTYLANPSYFILDEATSSMDPVTEELIQKAIKNITKNRTSIIIAHRLSTIECSDQIIVLEDGNIIESGSHQQLMNLNKKYSDYYKKQFTRI